MVRAVLLALAQLFSGRILGVLALCAALSVGTFVGVWFGIDAYVSALWPDASASSWLGWTGGLATLALAWFLFPIVASLFIGLFLDYVCRVVEEQHYPDLPAAPGISLLQGLIVALRYFAAFVLVNALLLVLLLFPPLYVAAWFVLNGYLIGREYVELVALRRLSPDEARSLRRRRSGESTLTGGVIALFMTIPLLNLVVPVFASAMTVHRFHDWRKQSA